MGNGEAGRQINGVRRTDRLAQQESNLRLGAGRSQLEHTSVYREVYWQVTEVKIS